MIDAPFHQQLSGRIVEMRTVRGENGGPRVRGYEVALPELPKDELDAIGKLNAELDAVQEGRNNQPRTAGKGVTQAGDDAHN